MHCNTMIAHLYACTIRCTMRVIVEQIWDSPNSFERLYNEHIATVNTTVITTFDTTVITVTTSAPSL